MKACIILLLAAIKGLSRGEFGLLRQIKQEAKSPKVNADFEKE
jgi:hypothetical protein